MKKNKWITGNLKKNSVLEMNFGTARNRLNKQILYKYICLVNHNYCYQCGEEIKNPEEMTIEHKIPWLNNGKELFWDLDNIAFSHPKCNYSKAKKVKIEIKHPSQESYKRGCRCDECKEIQKLRQRKFRAKINSN